MATSSESSSGSAPVVFEREYPFRMRLLVGVFPFAAALYLLWGVSEYLRAPESLRSMLPGFLIVLTLFLGFALLTWVVLAGRKSIVIDRARREVSIVHDVRFLEWSMNYPFDRVRDVRVISSVWGRRHRQSTSGGNRHSVWVVQIVIEGARPVIVSRERLTTEADGLARRLGALLETS